MKYLFLFMSFFIGFGLFAQDAEFIHTYEYGGGENILDIQQTEDNGLIAVGVHTLGIGASRIMLIKTDSLGEEEWHRFYGFPYSNSGRKIKVTSEGDFVILARTSGDTVISTMQNTYIIKTNSQGDTLWTRIFGQDIYPDIGTDLEITPEGDYLISGFVRSNSPTGASDAHFIKLDADGNLVYEKTLEQAGNQSLKAIEIADNGDILAGGIMALGIADVYILRLTSAGDTLWTKVIDLGGHEVVIDLKEMEEGSILVTGHTHNINTSVGFETFYIKISTTGEIIWIKIPEGSGDNDEIIVELIDVGNNEFVALSHNYNGPGKSVQLQKMDENMNVIWESKFSDVETGFDAYTLLLRNDGGFVIGGTMDFENSECSICGALVRTNEEGLATPTKNVNEVTSSFSIFPNPNQGTFFIEIETELNQLVTIELYNITGQLIYQQINQLAYGKNNLNFSFTEIPKGSYFLTIKNDTGIIESQVLLIQ